MAKQHIKLTINGEAHELLAEPRELLIHTLREQLKITGPHIGCETSHCGACTIDMNGRSVKSCTVFAVQAEGAEITTIEGVSGPEAEAVQAAWVARNVPQCGYCQSGQVVAATQLLRDTPEPSDADIDDALSGNVCRCASYVDIRAAIHDAAKTLKG